MRYKPILSQVFLRFISALANDIFNHSPHSFTNPNRDVHSYPHSALPALSPPPPVCADILVSAGVGQGECRKKYRSAVVRACEWRVDIISGAALMCECRDRRMSTPGRVAPFPCAFIVVRVRLPGALWCVCGGVRIPPFRSAGGSDRRPEVEGAGRKGGRSPTLSGLGIAASSGQSIVTSSMVSCPVMISSTAARV